MSNFEPFDDTYKFDKTILTENFPDYQLTSIKAWMRSLLTEHGILKYVTGSYLLENSSFILPLNQAMRKTFASFWEGFWSDCTKDISTMRNVISYILQNHAYKRDGEKLEGILGETSSAYSVELGSDTKLKLVYRVSPVAKKQAEDVFTDSELVAQAWESHYGIKPDDEKTITRATDALAGILRDKYFPDENRPQLGTLLGKMRQKPELYPLPASDLYDTDKFLELMKDFSKIRGNHKTGTGRSPSHEEAGFVLHFTIMLFQLLKK